MNDGTTAAIAAGGVLVVAAIAGYATRPRRVAVGRAEGGAVRSRREVTVPLSAGGARILKMVGPGPLRGADAPRWSGNRVTVDDGGSVQLLLAQSGPGTGFPRGDRKRILAAAERLGRR